MTSSPAESIIYWQWIQESIDQVPPEMVLRLLTSTTPLCQQAEELFQEDTTHCGAEPVLAPSSGARCQGCPLFRELGGQQEDVGCRSLIDPIIAAVQVGDRNAAGALIAGVIKTHLKMPLSVLVARLVGENRESPSRHE